MNWRHALDMNEQKFIPSDEDNAMLDAIAKRVVDMGFSVPAILFLESMAPLNYIGSQMVAFFSPMVHAFFTGQAFDRFQQLMEKRESVELLVRRIEKLQYTKEHPSET
jgi:hypothetical protein